LSKKLKSLISDFKIKLKTSSNNSLFSQKIIQFFVFNLFLSDFSSKKSICLKNISSLLFSFLKIIFISQKLFSKIEFNKYQEFNFS
jgi:hypothetical protein